MSQLRVWVRNCAKCGKRFTTTDESHNVFNWYLCWDCGKLWEKFFQNNHQRLEILFQEAVNPTWGIFIGELSDKERVEFT
jgi:DNA-directed RNA polymerase subunit RPC12/RpoP